MISPNLRKRLKKINIATLILSFMALTIFPYIQNVKGSSDQQANLTIGVGTITLTAPSDFSFDPIFIAPGDTTPFYIYKELTPLTTGKVVRVTDNNNINNFKVTMNVSNFTKGASIIPFSHFSFVTLASDAATGIDSESGAPATNFTMPEKCAWDQSHGGTLQDNCQSDFLSLSGAGSQSDAVDIIVSNEPDSGRQGTYSLGMGYKLLIDPTAVSYGNYDGTITFTLYQCPDGSCL